MRICLRRLSKELSRIASVYNGENKPRNLRQAVTPWRLDAHSVSVQQVFNTFGEIDRSLALQQGNGLVCIGRFDHTEARDRAVHL